MPFLHRSRYFSWSFIVRLIATIVLVENMLVLYRAGNMYVADSGSTRYPLKDNVVSTLENKHQTSPQQFVVDTNSSDSLLDAALIRSLNDTANILNHTRYDVPLAICQNCSGLSVLPAQQIQAMYAAMPGDIGEIKTQDKYYTKRVNRVSPYPHDYVTRPSNDFCTNLTFMVILVHSGVDYVETRQAIRKTWGSVSLGGSWPFVSYLPQIRLVFMLGKHTTEAWNSYVLLENDNNDDIVQGDFHDSYVNMTLKSLLGLKWVSEHCKHAKYMIKSDDDMILNLPYIVRTLETIPLRRTIMGPLNPRSKTERIGLWGVPAKIYPFEQFPVYASGSAYIISVDIVRELFDTAEYMPRIHVDDVFITGILARVIGVKHTTKAKAFAYWGSKRPTACDIVLNKVMTGTKVKDDFKYELWSLLADKSVVSKCLKDKS